MGRGSYFGRVGGFFWDDGYWLHPRGCVSQDIGNKSSELVGMAVDHGVDCRMGELAR